jgi:hypothetical protein
MTTPVDGHKYVAFTTKAKQDDGTYLVSGRISNTSLDLDGERCDATWLEKAANDWFKDYGNIREMHQPVAIGKAKSLTGSAVDGFDITAKIVDPLAIKKLENDIYTGFSIGIKGTRYDRSEKALQSAPGGIIIGGKIVESSLVDVPCNTDAKIEKSVIAKAADIGDVATAGMPPCTECGGVGKTLTDGDWSTCPKCNGDGQGKNDILPGLNSGPDEHGEVGKTVRDIYGFREDEVTLKAGDPDCKTCDGKGTINDGNRDCPDCVAKSVEADVYKKDFSDKERSDLADKDQAMPDGSFPIRNVSDLKNAIQAFGRAKNKVAVKAWIIRRAKALGQADLIPEAWGVAKKSAMADALVALSLVNKGAEPGQWTHDPDALKAVEDGIIACLQQELEELSDGEDERWDLQVLLDSLNGFLSWQMHEAFGGETTSPFAQGDDLTMFVSADVMKAAQAEGATDEEKAAPAIELAKALGIDKIAVTTEDISKKVADLEKVVETVSKMHAPRNWALQASQEQQEVQVELEAATRQLNAYKSAQAECSAPTDRAAYDTLVAGAQSKVDALTSKIGA